jgi:hypothetical protein
VKVDLLKYFLVFTKRGGEDEWAISDLNLGTGTA